MDFSASAASASESAPERKASSKSFLRSLFTEHSRYRESRASRRASFSAVGSIILKPLTPSSKVLAEAIWANRLSMVQRLSRAKFCTRMCSKWRKRSRCRFSSFHASGAPGQRPGSPSVPLITAQSRSFSRAAPASSVAPAARSVRMRSLNSPAAFRVNVMAIRRSGWLPLFSASNPRKRRESW